MSGHDVARTKSLDLVVTAEHTANISVGDDPHDMFPIEHCCYSKHLLRDFYNHLLDVRLWSYHRHLIFGYGLSHSKVKSLSESTAWVILSKIGTAELLYLHECDG